MKRSLLILLTAVLFLIPLSTAVNAYTLTERKNLKYDESLYVKDQEIYAFPEKILVTRVVGAPKSMADNTKSWLNMLYYYFITRLQFADLPFNYLLDRKGNVYQGRSGWEGAIPELENPEGVIMIAYLSDGSDVTTPANLALKELIEKLSYQYGISAGNVEVVDISVAPKEKDKLAKLTYTKSLSIFAQEAEQKFRDYTYTNEDHLEVFVEVEKAEAPTSVKAGENFEVKLKLKNTGKTPWFTLNDFIYVVTANGGDSQFAINGEWDSFDTPVHLEGETIFPNESYDLIFKMKAPFFPGEYSESFGVKRLSDDRIIERTQFDVKFSVEKGDFELIEILDTETGFLRVREIPSTGGQELGQVPSGGTYIYTAIESGWYKIKYDGDKEGWVHGRFVKQL